jgi:hypothetical protein
MTTKTLDERIREQARKELAGHIGAMFAPIASKWNCAGNGRATIRFPYENPPVEIKNVYMAGHIEAIRDTLVSALSPAAEEAAVAAFVQKVESLQEQIDSLNIQQ